jgi:hypothetical protein
MGFVAAGGGVLGGRVLAWWAGTDVGMTFFGPRVYEDDLPVRSRAEIALRLGLQVGVVGVMVALTAATIATLAWSVLAGAGH